MSKTSDQLVDDLRNLVPYDVFGDPLTRGLYSTDASAFQLMPRVVVQPRDEADVISIVKFANENAISLTARGAGTGLAGESLGEGICLDFSKHFRAMRITDDRVTVEPGVTFREVQAALARHGRRLAIDPANENATLGGLLATNGSGSNSFRHGYLSNHVESLRVVWSSGDAATVPQDHWPAHRELQELLETHADILSAHTPRTPFHRWNLSPTCDLVQMLVGTEGTLGLIVSATIRTIPLAGGVCQFTLGFASLEGALQTANAFQNCDGIVVCDVLDQRLLVAAIDTKLSHAIGAAVVVCFEAETELRSLAQAQTALERVKSAHPCVMIHAPSCEPHAIALQRAFRQAAAASLFSISRGRRPEPFVEDIGVPVESVSTFVSSVHDILRTENLNASFLVHLLTGIIHTRPLLDLNTETDREVMWRFADKIHCLAISLGGTISAQHGVGLARTPWMEHQFGPLMPVLREVKRLFDPRGILNPGKLIRLDPSRPAWPLRAPVKPLVPLLATTISHEMEATKCNACGDCRPQIGSGRMCPVGRATRDETGTPRAKANVFRLIDDSLPLSSEEVADLANLCINCKMCRSECRAKVDVPTLMLEAKAQHYAVHGLSRGDWILARSETLMRWASPFATTVNFLLARRSVRWLVEHLVGISRQRRVPRVAGRSFLNRAWWLGLTRRRRSNAKHKVVYFVDQYANVHAPEIAEATVAVLKHVGCEVVVPYRQRPSGMTPFMFGDVDTAREWARMNVRTLVEYVRDGYTVICSEPTAAVALCQDYQLMLPDEDTALVARHTRELMAYLGELHASGALPAPTERLPTTIAHHVPCHVKALGDASGPTLLRLIPELVVQTLDESCSGMAGVWGMASKNYATSIQAGQRMIAALDQPRILHGSSECSACRMQMHDTTGKRILHPIQYLARSYGLLPEIEDLLTKPQ